MLDVTLGYDYILAVSSPGVDRKFFSIEQLNYYLGEELEFKTKELINGKRKFNGSLSECDENYFHIKQNNKDKKTIKFKFSDLDLCKLKPKYNKLIKEYSNAK